MIRRLKADVEKDLPAKTETILFTALAPIQRDVYKQCLLREISTVQGSAAANSRGPLLNLVMQLRKCCNHPYLFPHVEDRSLPALGEHLVDACGKLKVLDKLLARLKERNHRVLVFSQMTRMLDVLEDFLVMRFGCGVFISRRWRLHDHTRVTTPRAGATATSASTAPRPTNCGRSASSSTTRPQVLCIASSSARERAVSVLTCRPQIQ